jgi:hypothetical protein
MAVKTMRSLAALALFGCAITVCSYDVLAQRDLRVPGRTGVRSRPNESPSEKKKQDDAGAGDTVPADPFTRFPQAPEALNAGAGSLRTEFIEARAIYNKLKPEQFVAGRLLAQYARETTNATITPDDLYRGLADKKSYRTTLKAKGLTGGQVDQLMQRLREKMSELLR